MDNYEILSQSIEIYGRAKDFDQFSKSILEFLTPLGGNPFIGIRGINSDGYKLSIINGNFTYEPLSEYQITNNLVKWGDDSVNGIISWNNDTFDNIESILKSLGLLLYKSAFYSDSIVKKEYFVAERILGIHFHDIRNSMGSISGTAQLMELDADGNEELLEGIRDIISIVTNFDSDTKDFMRFVRSEEIEYKKGSISLSNLCNNYINQNIRVLEVSSIALNSNISDNIELYGDNEQFVAIIKEVFSNAFDAVEDKEGAEISVNLIKDSENIIFSIEDNGEGISYWLQRYIFAPFYSTKVKRMGLGLYRVASYLKYLGGAYTVKSELGVGTKIEFTIPV